MKPGTFSNIDEYIELQSPDVRKLLIRLRDTIRKAAPEATEKISYQMPTFFLNGNLVHFAAFRNHIGFYPAPSGLEAFIDEVSKYKNSKGAVQFPLDKPLPLKLVEKIVRYRVKENKEKLPPANKSGSKKSNNKKRKQK